MKKIRMSAVVLVFVLLTQSLSFASAVTEETDDGVTEEQIQDAAAETQALRERLAEAQRKLAQSKEELGSISDQADALDQELADLQAVLEQLAGDITDAEARLEALETSVAELEERTDKQYEDTKKRIRFMYANARGGYLELLFDVGSFPEFLNRVRYFADIAAYDRAKLHEYADTLEQLEQTRQEAAAELETLRDLYAVQQENEQALTEKIEEAQEQMRLLMAQVDSEASESAKLDQMYEDALAFEAELEQQKALEDLARMEEIKRQEQELKEAKRKAEEERKKAAEEEAARRAAEEEARRKAQEEARQKAEEEARRKAEEEAAAQAEANQESTETSENTENTENTDGAESQENTQTQETVLPDDSTEATDPALYDDGTESRYGEIPLGYTENDLILMATIIQCEADGEPYDGKILVGEVVLNRMYSPSFPNTISGVIYQNGQFSPVASGRFAAALAAGPYQRNIDIARTVLENGTHSDYLFFRVDTGIIDGYVIGHHVFY